MLRNSESQGQACPCSKRRLFSDKVNSSQVPLDEMDLMHCDCPGCSVLFSRIDYTSIRCNVLHNGPAQTDVTDGLWFLETFPNCTHDLVNRLIMEDGIVKFST